MSSPLSLPRPLSKPPDLSVPSSTPQSSIRRRWSWVVEHSGAVLVRGWPQLRLASTPSVLSVSSSRPVRVSDDDGQYNHGFTQKQKPWWVWQGPTTPSRSHNQAATKNESKLVQSENLVQGWRVLVDKVKRVSLYPLWTLLRGHKERRERLVGALLLVFDWLVSLFFIRMSGRRQNK